MKNFNFMNQLIRRGSGANLNLFRYAAMVLVLLTLGAGNAWAGHGGACTAKLQVNKGTGSGSVYAATTSSATSGNSSVSADCGNSDDGTHTHTFYAFATPADGYTFLGWTESATSTAGADASNPKAVTITSESHNTVTKTLYAHFVEKAKVNITFEAPSNGTYTIKVNGGSAETVSSANVVKSNVTGVTLTATPASGYAFAGWYKLNSAGEFVEDLSIASPYDAAFTESETIKMGARFVPTTLGKFILKGSSTEYYGLKAATVAAGGSGVIVPVAAETVVDGSDLLPFDNGTYIIKAGATLLVPHSSANSVQIEPEVVTTAKPLYAYRTLHFIGDVNVICNGVICVGGKIMSASGGSKSAYPTDACGVINMAKGGHIELNNGAKLYCWGFVKGQDMDQGNNTVGVGTITANAGAVIKEDFAVGDWRGGTATSAIYNKRSSWKLFPFQSYSIQNVEVPTTFKYGSTLNTFVVVSGGGGNNPADFDIAGSNNTLFLLRDDESVVRKWYDPTTDLTCYELSGSAKLDALNIEVYISLSSGDFYLPISNSMHIILKDCNMTMSKPMTMQAGSVIEIKEGATANLESRLHLFDKDEWGLYIHDYYFRSFNNLTSHKNRGAENSKDGLEDAKLIVDGTLNVVSGKGYLYTSKGGANVMGNGGGKVVFGGSLPSGTESIHHVNTASSSESYIKDSPNDFAAANLCNEDGSYTKSIGSSTFHNVHGRWFVAANKDERANHTYAFKYMANGNSGDDVPTDAVYAPDKTGLVAGMKWCNVEQDGTCSNIFNATQALNETPASDIRYTYPSDSWLQLLKTETEGVYGGSDNSLYAVDGCAVNSLGSVDENCLYTINDVKKALVDGHFVALEKNTEDEAWHDVANPTNYYICFEGCNWHPATKYAGEEKAYIVEEGDYIWYNNNWLLVEREDPFFFDYNDQNVKRYYEYEDGAWVLASPRVRVEDAIETREFYKLPEAITVASGKKNTTITILKDISGINTRMTYSASNTTCTLDLNGHTVSGAAPFGDDNNRGLLIINASGTTFTITDNSTNKEGRLENICNQNKVTYTVHLMAGTLNVEHGTIHAENPAQYAAKANAATGITEALTACGARGIQVNAAQKLNVTGGCIEAYATRNAYGVAAAGNAANTTLVTVSGGTIYAEAPYGAYGINCSGKLHVSGGTITGHLNTAWADGQYTQGSNSDRNCHQYAYGINMTASSNATASSCYYGTLTMTGGTVQATSAWDASYTCYAYGVRIQKALTAVADASKTADGTHSQKASAIGSITGGTISVDIKGNYAYGVFVEGNYNSYNKTSNTFHISGATITSKAKNYAYGVYANASIDGTCGGYHYGIVEQDNNTVTAQTTAAYAYAVYVVSTSTTIFQDKQANYYGEYATAAEMTINSGTYTASAGSSTAYAAVSSTRSKSTYGSTTSVETNRTLGGNAEAYAKLIINGGTFNATTKTTTARGVSSGGNTTIKDATFNVVAGSYNAYGLYALSGKLTATNVIVNDTAKGRTSSSNNNANAYGVLVDCSIPNGNTAQTGFAYAGDVELNNCTINAVTTTYDNARALYVNATNKVYNWTTFKADSLKGNGSGTPWSTATYNAYKSVFPCTLQGRDNVSYAIAATATVNGGTFTAKAGRASAYGAVSTQTSVPANKEVTASPEMTLKNATFIAQTGTSTTAYGVQTGGPTLIEGCTITATAGNSTKYQSTASGVRALDKTTAIKNSTITATATDAAYGLEGYVEINATHGYCWHGEFDLSEAGTTEVTAEAKTSGKKAWSVYLQATNKNIASGNFAGDYATAANATINGGTYKAIASGSGASAYSLSIAGKKTQGEVSAQPEVEVLDGFFNGATAEVGTAGVVGHMQLKGGYFVHNTNLATYAVAPKSVWTLPTTHENYNPYKYKITEHYTITFKNGTTQLQQNDLEAGTTPIYSGTPTKDANAQYTYTFDGWSTTDGGDKLASLPAVSADATYFAHYSKTERKYTVNVSAGEHGSVSPASVSNIGCETASGDITATPDAGYSFSGWTLPTGVTAATGYNASSNPIRINATATGSITASFVARNDINYTVKHWQQNIENDEYTEVTADQETKQGTTATSTAATAKSYTGFTAQPIAQGTIAGNGSTIVNIYYNRNTFTITWLDGNGNAVETDENVKYGATPEYNGTTPTRTATAQYSYTFNNMWLPALAPVAGNETYTAQFSQTTNQYTLTVVANDAEMGTVYGSGTYDYNAEISIAATPKDGYKFVKWKDESTDNPRTVTVTADATYTATFDYDKANYTVRHFQQNLDNNEYTEVTADAEVNSGTIGATTEAAAKSYTGFTPKPFEQQTIAVGGSTVVNIYYDRITYTITWKDGDGNTIETDENVKYGATPEYNGETPAKTATAQYTYTFNNTWSPAIVAVTEAATYTAQFGSTVNKYTITWKNKNGDVLRTDENVEYGITPSYGSTPTLDPTTSTVYTFVQWIPEVVSVTDDATYTADYSEAPRSYPVVWKNYNGDVLKESTRQWGWDAPAASTYNGDTPTKPGDAYRTCVFSGWSDPVSVVEGGDVTYTAQFNVSMLITEATPLTITSEETATTTTVKVSGKLDVTAGTLRTDELILEASENASGEIITGEGNIVVPSSGNAYFDLAHEGGFKANTWYAIAVPWMVNVPAGGKGGVSIKKNGEYKSQKLGYDFDLIYYDGARRANGDVKAWNFLQDDPVSPAVGQHVMTPGVAYMIYLTEDAEAIRFQKRTSAPVYTEIVEVSPYASSNTTYRNWNGIANPATYHAYMNVLATENKGQVYVAETRQYKPFDMEAKKLLVGQPIFVQTDVPATTPIAVNGNSYPTFAPRRAKAQELLTRYELYLAPSQDVATDEIIVRMSEEKEENDYVVGQDLVKMGVSDLVPQLWIDRYDSKMYINTVAPEADNTADYPLGIRVPQSGEYDLFLDDELDSESNLYLTYDGEAIWNLSYGPYVASLEKGTNTHYGLRIVKKAPQTTTGIEETTIQNGEAVRKVLVNDKVYIIRNGLKYSVTGQKAK